MKRVLLGLGISVLVIGAGTYGYWRWQNRPPQLVSPNYHEYYLEQDTTPVGKVGVFVSGLILPEDMRAEDFYHMAEKSRQYMPWPFRGRWAEDKGVLLLDPDRYYEFEAFEPARLVDPGGSDRDTDGIPYVEKYQRGEVQWVAPKGYLDHGYFLLPTRKGGMPTVVAKLTNKVRHFYYTPGKGSVLGKVPSESGQREIVSAAMDLLQVKYGPIPWRQVTAENPSLARAALYELLDSGVQTIIFAPPRPIYSHHEEFNGSIRHTVHLIEEWESAHPGKRIKFIITPQLGDFPVLRQAWVAMLKDRLDTLPRDAAVKLVVSVHGMAWDRVPHEAWIQRAPGYRDATLVELGAVLKNYGFPRTEAVTSQDQFASPAEDPAGKYLSTNEAFWDGINGGFDYVIQVPIEFFTESTDTLFGHAMKNFDRFPGYDRYETLDYGDWSQPFVREFTVEDTKVIYNGAPVGRYKGPIVEAYAAAIESVLAKRVQPVAAVRGQDTM